MHFNICLWTNDFPHVGCHEFFFLVTVHSLPLFSPNIVRWGYNLVYDLRAAPVVVGVVRLWVWMQRRYHLLLLKLHIYIYIYIVKIGRDFGLGRKMAGFIYLFINYLDQRTIFEESLKRLCFETLNSKTLMELNKKTEWNEIKIRWLNWILGKITKSNLWFSQIFNYTQGKEPYISLRGVVTNSSWGSNFKIQMNPLVWLKKLYA